MHIISDCVEARNRLLGLTKTRTELTGPNGGPLEVEGGVEEFDMANIDKFLAAQYGKRLAEKKSGTTEPDGSAAFSG